jgi:hypothetical protein
MSVVERPDRVFNFTNWAKNHPREALPVDRLDAQFTALIRAIETTQSAVADLRRDDGKLRNGAVGHEQLSVELIQSLTGAVADICNPLQARVTGVAEAALTSEQNASLFAKDAERAVTVAQQLVSGLSLLRYQIDQHIDYIQRAASSVDSEATEAENWASYSQAMADNATKAKDEALAWAEFLAGPVVNSADAPAYIAGSPFPHGLYYQPVQGGVAGLWSAKWWALQAQNLVGNVGVYYLGAWATPPLPGQVNPDTGQVVPNPLLPGSFYFDTSTDPGTMKFWNGLQWSQPTALVASFQGQFVYHAVAGQTVFSGPDANGATPDVGTFTSEVHINGILLLPVEDYSINATSSALTIHTALLTAGSVVQWDMLLPAASLAPGSVNAFKMQPMVPDGVTQDFTLTYLNPVGGASTPAEVGDGAQLMVSLDGCVQEPGVSYTAAGSSLHMVAPPVATASLWAVWYQPGSAA